MKNSFKFQDKEYPIIVTRKKTKRIVIRVNPRGTILLSCPLSCPEGTALTFLEQSRAWVEKTIRAQEENAERLGVFSCLDYRSTYLYGNQYRLEEGKELGTAYEIREGVILYKGNPAAALEQLRRDNFWYIEKEFLETYKRFSGLIKQKPFLTIRKMKSRWGSCNHRTGRITVNRALVHLDSRLVRFVMYHEFAHLVHPNHGRAFKSLLGKLLPEYKTNEKELKNYVFLLQIE